MNEEQAKQPVAGFGKWFNDWRGVFANEPQAAVVFREAIAAGAAAADSAQPPLENETRVRLQRAGSPSPVGSEFLIARWQAKLEELEALAEQQRGTFIGLMAQTQEKARAYRACIDDLQRHARAQNQGAKENF